MFFYSNFDKVANAVIKDVLNITSDLFSKKNGQRKVFNKITEDSK